MTRRDPVSATARVVPPYLYEVLWSIAHNGPLTAQEIADDHNRPLSVSVYWASQTAANRLRGVIRLGLLERDPDGFYLLTNEGRAWITVGAEAA